MAVKHFKASGILEVPVEAESMMEARRKVEQEWSGRTFYLIDIEEVKPDEVGSEKTRAEFGFPAVWCSGAGTVST